MPDYVKDVELKINVSLPLRKTAWRHFFFFFFRQLSINEGEKC